MHNRDRIGIAAAGWAIGMFAVLCDHFQPSAQLRIGIHALFAVVTCGAISLVLIDKARGLAGTSQWELHEFTRLVSRWVYILLYTLALMRLAVYLYEASQHYLADEGQHAVALARPLDDFQLYIGCCVASLWSVRALVLAVPFKSRNLQTRTTGQSGNLAHSPPLRAK
jgi:hypothetical protein